MRTAVARTASDPQNITPSIDLHIEFPLRISQLHFGEIKPDERIGGAFNGEIDDATGESSQDAGMAEAVASCEGVEVGSGKVGEGSVEREMVGGGSRRARDDDDDDGG